MNHVDLRAKATAATRSVNIQAMFKPPPHDTGTQQTPQTQQASSSSQTDGAPQSSSSSQTETTQQSSV
eukprot:5098711-Alexandrium_andersonii.AAC.1